MATAQTAPAPPGLRFLHPISSTPSYCEENVYLLAQAAAAEGHLLRGVYAAFISNATKQVPIWAQRRSSSPEGLALWDYHVVLVALRGSSLAAVCPGGGPLVIDVDSSLPLPCPLRLYARQALVGPLEDPHRRLFRVVPAADYLEAFASDRSHMLRAGAGAPPGAAPADAAALYHSPPPPHPCIVSKAGKSNTLPRYLAMPRHGEAAAAWRGTALAAGGALPYGAVLTEEAFLDFMEHAAV